MKKYNVDKEVWITEIGWPTIGRGFMKTFLTGAFKAAGIRTAGLTLAVWTTTNAVGLLFARTRLPGVLPEPQGNPIRDLRGTRFAGPRRVSGADRRAGQHIFRQAGRLRGAAEPM